MQIQQFHGLSKSGWVELNCWRRRNSRAVAVDSGDGLHTRFQDTSAHGHHQVRIDGVGVRAHFNRRAEVIESTRAISPENREGIELLVQFAPNRRWGRGLVHSNLSPSHTRRLITLLKLLSPCRFATPI
jgi:hypothetical protein